MERAAVPTWTKVVVTKQSVESVVEKLDIRLIVLKMLG